MDDKGNIILLKYQDRALWYRPLINQGNYFLEIATQDESSVYHLEAAIAWCHATATDFEHTNWKAIYYLYTVLAEHHSSGVIMLNKAIAAAYAIDRKTSIAELQAIHSLDHYYLYHTALGEVYFDDGDSAAAKQSFEKALQLTNTPAERQLLQQKIAACDVWC
jgi:RNA polymerase sigma-70 factor (ECF subfamily)